MKWILVYIFINPLVPGDVMSLEPVATNAAGSRVTYNDMYECFDARERLVEVIGRPIVNYQAVCVIEEEY